ncbi:putative transcriptional regulator [Marinomonas sp. MED121]|uniref:TetR/AcrR family transcriptional regulator n=1 Tax=Marinomonas sp. MED121 TaxID=314277 RepID=UPI00006911F8|nr:TetR/AcrR family transcriptional regulator [Marinomonas sp. MED121]EAQ67113.1 putative transcriptional regulator [Marinomonas sp. MED121]
MRKPSRRTEYAEQTRDALLVSARKSFVEKGFQATSLDDVAESERLTKGALYHHFKTKKALFSSVFDQVLKEAVVSIMSALAGQDDPVKRTHIAIDTFLQIALNPDYQHIILKEGPLALGWQTWREKEQASSIQLIKALLVEMKTANQVKTDSIDLAACTIMGALTEMVYYINNSEDQVKAAQESKRILLDIVATL